MSYADVEGVQTWYEDHGIGDPLVLLHGGFSDASEFGGTAPALAEHFHVFTPERRGHGHTPDVPGPISYELMAADTVAFLDQLKIGRSHLVGHSDGANVALLVALARPDLVDRLVLISGNFHHDGLVAGLDVGDLAANDYLADVYGKLSPDGRDHFPVIADKILRMATTEPTLNAADLAKVAARTLVMAGDDDMVSAEHTLLLYRGIPDSELAIVPGTSHALIIEKPDLCNRIILDFLTKDPTPTFMPIRRAQAPVQRWP
jgi:pimeloyl-ACP methyl ester carboxylesterase